MPLHLNLKIAAVLLPMCAIIMVVSEILVTNELAGLGDSVQELEYKTEEIVHNNELLSQQVASSSSLFAIDEKARGLGFTDPTSQNFLTLDPGTLPVALRPQ